MTYKISIYWLFIDLNLDYGLIFVSNFNELFTDCVVYKKVKTFNFLKHDF